MTEPENDEWQPTGPVLDPNGALEQRPGTRPHAQTGNSNASTAGPIIDDAPLELARKPEPRRSAPKAIDLNLLSEIEGSVPSEPCPVKPPQVKNPATGNNGIIVVALVLLVVASATGFYLWSKKRAKTETPRVPAKAILFIDSEPPGASIQINDQIVGQTPFVQENLYAPTEISFQLALKGYKPFVGSFRGGETTTQKPTLVRLRK